MHFKPDYQTSERLFNQGLERQQDAWPCFIRGIRDAHQIAQAEQQASEVIQQEIDHGRRVEALQALRDGYPCMPFSGYFFQV